MFDFLKNIFGGGNKSSNTFSRSSKPVVDPMIAQRKREEDERRRREAAAKEAAMVAQARRDSDAAARERLNVKALEIKPQQLQKADVRNDTEKELDALTQKNLGQARKDAKVKGGIFDHFADFLAGGASEKRAQVNARNSANTQYQEKYGYNNDKDVIEFGNRTLQKANANSKAAGDSIKNTKTAVEVARYIPGAGLGELGANVVRGNFAGSQDADNRLLAEQMELTPAQIKALSPEDRTKYLGVAKGGLGAGLLDLVGLGAGSLAKSAAKGGVKQAVKNSAKSSVKQVIKDIATKQGAKTLVKNAAIGAGAGGVVGAGGAKILGAEDEDILQAGVRGAVGGVFGGLASSPLDIATTSLAKGKNAKNAVRGALVKGDATTVTDAAMKTAQRIAGDEKPVIPNMEPVDPTVDTGNKIEVSPGVMVEQKQERGNLQAEDAPVLGSGDPIDNTPAYLRKREADAQEAQIVNDTNAGVQDIGDVPAFQRQGRVLESEKADTARAAELENSLTVMPTLEQIRSSEYEMRAKFAKDVQARPDLRFQLQTKLNENLAGLKKAAEEGSAMANELDVLKSRLGDAQQQRKTAQALEAEQVGQPAMNQIDIPDVANPIALAKGDEIPFPEFANAVDGTTPVAAEPVAPELPPTVQPTAADNADAVAQGELRIPTGGAEPTVEGNQALQSDVEVQQNLVAAGITPDRGDSPVAMAADAEEAARAEAVGRQSAGQTDAPNTREAAVSQITDEEIRDDLMQNAPKKNTVNLEEAENSAKAFLNRMDDPQVVASFQTGTRVDDPESFYTALNAVRRLERINTPEAQQGIRNAIDAMAEYAAESGRGLRTVQVLFDDMPAAMKVDYLTRRLSKAGADLTDNDRAMLASNIQAADNATASLRALEDRARSLLDDGSITNGNITPEIQAQVRSLSEAIEKATREKEEISGVAFRDYQRHLDGEVPLGKRAGDVGRTLMLSAPSGRIFDVISTTATATDDMLTRGVANIVGKGVNAVRGSGTVQDTLANPRQLVKGIREGGRRIVGSFKGEDYVEDFLGEAKRSTRGDINTGGGIVRRTVRSLVETPTNLTRGLRQDQLYREGMQEAAKQGLEGDARKAYAELRTLVPTNKQLDAATDAQMRTNMLHENGASRMLNGLARQLDSNKALGGWLAPILRNQIAPFTSWLGGNLNRTFTDKNVLYNASHAVVEARRGNLQGVIDDVSKLAVNSAETYALGALLTQAGIITTEDANGDDYAGLYFHIGDRYIPVAAAGTAAVPIILGNAFDQASQAAAEDGSGASGFANALVVNMLKNAGVASVFGGENNLQSTISALAKGEVDVADTGVKFVGDFVRQYIPSLTGDINAFLNLNGDLNATGEAANTKVLTADTTDNANKQDVMATELAKTLNRVPFASQNLERDEGKLAQDPIDRMLKGSRDGAGTRDEKNAIKEAEKTLADIKKQYDKDGIPTTADDITDMAKTGDYDKAISGAKYRLAAMEADKDESELNKQEVRDQIEKFGLEKEGVPMDEESFKARMEEGNYDSVARGLEYKYSKIANDKDTAQSTKDEMQSEIAKVNIYREGSYSPDLVTAYNADKSKDGGIGVEDWRDMMNYGTPEEIETAKKLFELDEKMVNAGIIKESKYYWKGSGKGGRGGSRGGGGGSGAKAPNVSTDIATNNISFSARPLQKMDADGTPKSAVPTVELVKNYDTSKLKKIKVSKGVR